MKKLRNYLFFVILFAHSITQSQIVYYQDTFHGGVTGAGFSTGQGSGNGVFKIHIEPGSYIRKAFIICQRFGNPKNVLIKINGFDYLFSELNQVSDNFNIPNTATINPSAIHLIEITNDITIDDSLFFIDIPTQNNVNVGDCYGSFYLVILYEHLLMQKTSYALILNNQDLNNNEFYSIASLSALNSNFPIGFAIHSDRIGSFQNDGSKVFFNNNNIGHIYKEDSVNSNWGGSGVKGHFYYQNNQLFGLDDDNPDNVMSGSDGLANVSNYLQNNSQTLNFNFKWDNSFSNNQYNIYISFHLAYTTPCDTFSASVGRDTIICAGQAMPLQASGGMRYEWLPQKFLSCYDCPNPVFVGDSTITYTVRIWNNDSCSKVLPLRVVVRPAPVVHAYSLVPPICGTATGQIQVTQASGGQPPYSYTLQPGNLSSSTGMFANLSAGTYALSITDLLGCSSSQNITLPDTNNVQALFTANPEQGVAPLNVWFLNQSQNAQNYQWLIDGQSYSTQDVQYLFTQNGTYDVQLIATGAAAYCTDTFTLQVLVYEQLAVVLYNIFTPNADGSNDEFGCSVNVPCQISCRIFNRWGNLLSHQEIATATTGFIPLWDGANASGGVYFYEMEFLQPFGKQQVFKGMVTLVR